MAITVPIISEWNKTQLDKATKDIESFSAKSKRAFDGLASAGRKLTLGFAAVGVAAVAVGKDLLEAGERASTSNARIDQIAESMGLFGEVTGEVTDRLKDLANETARKTGVDQNQIKQAQATLLTFGQLANSAGSVGQNFDRATQAAVDLAAAGFGSVETNAVQLGKALNDPIKGLTALARSGVTFTEAEKEVIETLVESGNMYGAQKLILEAIEKQVGGTAVATANASDQMKVAFSQLQERLGEQLLPVLTALGTFFIEKLIPALEQAYNTVVPAVTRAWQDLSAALGPVIAQIRDTLEPVIRSVIDFLRNNTDVVKVFMAVLAGAAAVAMIAALAAAFVSLFNPVTLIIGAIAAAAAGVYYAWTRFETFRNVVTTAFEVIKTAAQAWWTVVKFVFDNVLGGTEGIGRSINIMKAVFTTGFTAMKNVVMGLYDAIKSVVDIAIRAKNAVGSAVETASNIPGVGAVTSTIGNIAGAIWPFADGGIVTSPMIGLVGEAGPEAIIPLDQVGGMGGSTFNINVTAGVGDPGRIGQEVVETIRAFERRNGTGWRA